MLTVEPVKFQPRAGRMVEDLGARLAKLFAARDGRFPLLKNRDDLWWLLVKITVRKAHDLAERESRQKRGGGSTNAGESALAGIPAAEPTSEDVAIMVEQFQRLLDLLGDETLSQIALWRLEGYSNDEIAERLGCARRTVANKLALIRKRWQSEVPP